MSLYSLCILSPVHIFHRVTSTKSKHAYLIHMIIAHKTKNKLFQLKNDFFYIFSYVWLQCFVLHWSNIPSICRWEEHFFVRWSPILADVFKQNSFVESYRKCWNLCGSSVPPFCSKRHQSNQKRAQIFKNNPDLN